MQKIEFSIVLHMSVRHAHVYDRPLYAPVQQHTAIHVYRRLFAAPGLSEWRKYIDNYVKRA